MRRLRREGHIKDLGCNYKALRKLWKSFKYSVISASEFTISYKSKSYQGTVD